MDEANLLEWARVVGTLSHYEVLGIRLSASPDDVRRGYSVFAESFHPDGHRGRSPREQEMVLHIFKHGTEAYRVLSDPQLRAEYDAPMRQEIKHPPSVIAALKAIPRTTQAPPARNTQGPPAGRLIDRVRVPSAKPFVMKAMQLRDEGQFKKAKLELTMAMNMDRDNPELAALMTEIEKALATSAK